MAEKKHSGFEAPTYGTVYPAGTKFKTNANGKLVPVLPKKSRSSKKNEVKK